MSRARSSCQNQDGDLVLPVNIEEHKAIWKVAKEKKLSSPWIALIEKQRDRFFTFDGKTPSYTNWDSSEPNPGGSENCVAFYGTNGEWHDISCNNNFHYICQKTMDTCKFYQVHQGVLLRYPRWLNYTFAKFSKNLSQL